jgi:hypothetical protein
MSRQTATPPPKPVAALLSPVLWQMEHPDKFDMYSVGIMFLQVGWMFVIYCVIVSFG